jgi:hypothetical protein
MEIDFSSLDCADFVLSGAFSSFAIEAANEAYEDKPSAKAWYCASADTLEPLRTARQTAQKAFTVDATNDNLQILRNARTAMKAAVRGAKNSWLVERSENIAKMKSSPVRAWENISELQEGFEGHHRPLTYSALRRPDGSIAQTDEEKAEVQRDYHGSFFNDASSFDEDVLKEIKQHAIDANLGTTPLFPEFNKILSTMGRRKAAGPNGVPMDLYQRLNHQHKLLLYDAFVRYWEDDKFDVESWHQVTLCLVFKNKGDKMETKNYRPLCLIDALAKLTGAIIAKRLTAHQQKVGLDEQFGFMSGRGTADASTTLKVALQELKNANYSTYVLFVDLVKAFDTVNRELIFQILPLYGVPKEMIDVIKKLYKDVEFTTTSGKASASAAYTSGVKQGCPLSPVLFLFIMQAVCESLDQKWTFKKPPLQTSSRFLLVREKRKTGMSDTDLTRTVFADDGAFLLLSREDLIAASKLIVTEFKRFGLIVHLGTRSTKQASKTEAMFIPPRNHPNSEATFTHETADYDVQPDRFISFCDSFKYLGSLIVPSLSDDLDIDARVNKARYAQNLMRPILTSKAIPQLLRAQLYKQTVLNILLFGCETWALTEHQLGRLTRVHTDCARSIYGITRWHHQHEHVYMEEVLGALLLDPLEITIEERTLKFLAKTAQLPEDNLTRRIVCCQATRDDTLCSGRRPKHTKGRFLEVLKNNNLLRTGKDTHDSLGSMDVWKPKLVAWSKTGSKLERWYKPRKPRKAVGLNASAPCWFHPSYVASPPAQSFWLNASAPLWFPFNYIHSIFHLPDLSLSLL